MNATEILAAESAVDDQAAVTALTYSFCIASALQRGAAIWQQRHGRAPTSNELALILRVVKDRIVGADLFSHIESWTDVLRVLENGYPGLVRFITSEICDTMRMLDAFTRNEVLLVL